MPEPRPLVRRLADALAHGGPTRLAALMLCAGAWSYAVSSTAAAALDATESAPGGGVLPALVTLDASPTPVVGEEPYGPPVDPAALAAFAAFADAVSRPTA